MSRFLQGLGVAAVLAAGVSAAYVPAMAATTDLSPAAGFSPRVPVSALAIPAGWLDPSRLQVSTSVSVGSGFGRGTEALQVTSLSYRFAKPLWMNVNVGNAWGPLAAARGGSALFLEGLDLGYRPFESLQFQVHYRDFRSPLQYAAGYYSRPFWGQ